MRQMISSSSCSRSAAALGGGSPCAAEARPAKSRRNCSGFSPRGGENREVPLGEVEPNIDSVGDLLAAGHRLGMMGKPPVHFLRALDIKLVAAVGHAFVIGQLLSGINRQQHFVGEGIALTQIVGVASGHERPAFRWAIPLAEGALTLNFQPVVLNFHVKVLAEDAGKPFGDASRFVQLVPEDGFGKLARRATAEAIRPSWCPSSSSLSMRDVVVAFQIGLRRHLDQVFGQWRSPPAASDEIPLRRAFASRSGAFGQAPHRLRSR